MGASDGKVIGAVKILDNGSEDDRFNMVLVAEGYRESELPQFRDDAAHFVRGLMKTAPFDAHACAINIWRLEVASTESGADDPAACGGSGAEPKTFFDARFCATGFRRGLAVDSDLVQATAKAHVPRFHSAQVIVNSPVYGGTGGIVGVSSNAEKNLQGLPIDWREIVIHEMGHSIFGLADEYFYRVGCEAAEPAQDQHSSMEPLAPNVTLSPTAQGKWSDLISTTQLPTSTNLNCGQCPAEITPTPSSAIVGTFEGAHYTHCGAYRPSYQCKMRTLGAPFCAVCRRVIHEFLTPYDPDFCLTRDKLDLNRWSIAVQILFGVIQDGGGRVVIGGKPVPIDPWGPLRHSIWAAMANPHDAAPAVRDTVVGLALGELASLISAPEYREQIEALTRGLLEKAAGELPARTIL